MIASSFGPSELAAPRIAWATNQVRMAAPNAQAAPMTTGRRRDRLPPTKLAVTAAKIRTASRPSRKTMIDELKTAVPWLWWISVGSIGPVLAVAIR